MREKVKDLAKRYRELQTQVEALEEKIQELRRDTFSAESQDTEEKARELFSEVGVSSDGSSKTAEMDELQDQKAELESEIDDIEEELRELLVNVTFPLNEEINTDNETVSFPYSDPIDQEVLDGIAQVLGGDFGKKNVSIETEAITVDTDSVDKAIDAVQEHVQDIRQSAEALLDISSHVDAVHERDSKVAAMLYILDRSQQDSLTKKEMEKEIGLDKGDLRGQLYHVLNDDPYLTKHDQQVSLTSTGQEVIEEFVRKYGTPSLITNNSEEDDEGDKEVVA